MFSTVYPTLDLSDDEDYPVFKPRGKKKEDEAWNPKARVRVQGPRPERPMRQGVRRQAVEKGLEQAAARRQNLPVSIVYIQVELLIGTRIYLMYYYVTNSRLKSWFNWNDVEEYF